MSEQFLSPPQPRPPAFDFEPTSVAVPFNSKLPAAHPHPHHPIPSHPPLTFNHQFNFRIFSIVDYMIFVYPCRFVKNGKRNIVCVLSRSIFCGKVDVFLWNLPVHKIPSKEVKNFVLCHKSRTGPWTLPRQPPKAGVVELKLETSLISVFLLPRRPHQEEWLNWDWRFF